MKWVKPGIIALCVAIALMLFPNYGVAQSAEIATGSIDYSRILSFIQTSPIPVRLPEIVVYENNLASNGQFFAVGGLTTNVQGMVNGYNVTILDSPYCRSALACTLAYATAEPLTWQTPSLDQIYAWMQVPGEGMDQYLDHAGHAPGWITLSGGQQVYLVPWLNGGAGAGYEQILWDENGYRYTVALKWGDPTWLMQMVESIFQP